LAVTLKLFEVEANEFGSRSVLGMATGRRNLVSFPFLQGSQVAVRLVVEVIEVLVNHLYGITYGLR
jgi:hypothetical protein